MVIQDFTIYDFAKLYKNKECFVNISYFNNGNDFNDLFSFSNMKINDFMNYCFKEDDCIFKYRSIFDETVTKLEVIQTSDMIYHINIFIND